MDIEKLFKVTTAIAIPCIIVSALLHVFLLMSDSPEYRKWVYTQITLQLLAAIFLFFARHYNPIALFLFVVLSIPFTYINSVYTNYGNMVVQLIAVTIFWGVFGYLIYGVRHKFIQKIRASDGSVT